MRAFDKDIARLRKRTTSHNASGMERTPLVSGLLLDRGGRHAPGNLIVAQRQQLLAAQRLLGNQWMQRELAQRRHHESEVATPAPPGCDEVIEGGDEQSFTLSSAIPWATHASPPRASAAPKLRRVVSPDAKDEEGDKVDIDKSEPGKAKISVTDAVSPKLALTSTIAYGNPDLGPDAFGQTSWSAEVLNPVAKANRARKVFDVTAVVNCPVQWDVHSTGNPDASSATSPNLNAKNWPTAASDLTPNIANHNGRPPRTKFWARDLTKRHELYHAHDFQKYGKAAFSLANTWLAQQVVGSAAGARKAANKVAGQMMSTIETTYLPRAEHRAYGDGAPDYGSLAFDIAKNGKAGLYPAAPVKKKKKKKKTA